MENSIRVLRIVGISFLCIFVLFFALGSLDLPLAFEVKKSDVADLYLKPQPKKKKPVTKQQNSIAQKQTIGDSTNVKDSTNVIMKPQRAQGSPVNTPDGVERVLLIGDSQLDGLRNPVSSYCDLNNHVLVSTIIWYGSSTKEWATTDTLEYYLESYKPTVVIFAIGLNELFVRDLEKRSTYVRSIKKTFQDYGVRYSWVGPAAWTPDKGIIGVMSREVGEHFFPSHTIKLDRASDGRHPSKSASKLWFDQVAESLTTRGVINFSNKVEKMTRLKFSRTILLSLKK